jgi:AmmeMemoRadiSam system protein A
VARAADLKALRRHAASQGRKVLLVAKLERLEALRNARGAFVTLKEHGQLRGCIGSSVARRPLIADVVDHAFNAAFRDPRFPPLHVLETTTLELSVSVLTPPAAMQFANEEDLVAQLRPGIDGLVISDHGRGALFLPIVWNEIRDPRHFLLYLKRKAGLSDDHFSPGFTARRFRTIEVKGHMVEGASGAVGRDSYAWRVSGI